MTISQLNTAISSMPEAPGEIVREFLREIGRKGGLAGKGKKHNRDKTEASIAGKRAINIRWGNISA